MTSPVTPRPVPESSYDRLLEAARQLFSSRGYENTSTAMIAREAKSSESQLVKHFGGKEGLLEAIFEDGWKKMGYMFEAVEVAPTPRDKLRMLLDLFLRVFEQDPALKELMLLESRRVRKEGHSVMLTQGYGRFVMLVEKILAEMANRGELREGFTPPMIRTALVGLLEGLLREQLLAARHQQPAAHLTPENIRMIFNVVFEAMLAEKK
jgi:AcrR family transcriptional regulator